MSKCWCNSENIFVWFCGCCRCLNFKMLHAILRFVLGLVLPGAAVISSRASSCSIPQHMIKSTILRVVKFLHTQSSEPCVVLGCSSGGFCIKSGQRRSRSWHQACTCTLTPSIFVYASDFWACLVMLEWWRCYVVMLGDYNWASSYVGLVKVFGDATWPCAFCFSVCEIQENNKHICKLKQMMCFQGQGMHMIRN
jgi:hypothetical protein